MIIIHLMNKYHTRAVESTLKRHLNVMPVVVVLGARQSGKSTLVQYPENQSRRYESLDEFETLATLSKNPEGLLRVDQDLTLDEVQRLPKILLEVKRLVDEERRHGRFLITGSANLLLMHDVAESLAGRASYLTLWPMSRREQLGIGTCGIWDEFITNSEKDWLELVVEQALDEPIEDQLKDWRSTVKHGGYPIPALELTEEEDRSIWFDGYIRTYIERDVLQLANISNLVDFRRLTMMASHRIGQLVNQSELGRSTGIPQATVNRYLNLLETSYQLVRLPAYASNRTKRLVKAPKLYWSDTGVALSLSSGEPTGAHFENLILCDLLIWRDSIRSKCEIFHWRTTHGAEVDFVLETSSGLIPIEVKSTTQPRLRDTTNLRAFIDEYGSDARSGLLIHSGIDTKWLTNNVLAIPWWQIL